jgi:uncharacterized membrane protein (UPF0136 family)
MKLSATFLLAYGLFVLVGGIFGYVKAKSMPSLISGVVSALIVTIAAVIFQHHPRLSLGLGATVGLVLTVVMFVRFNATKKPMPALPVAFLSLITLAYCAFKLSQLLRHHAS